MESLCLQSANKPPSQISWPLTSSKYFGCTIFSAIMNSTKMYMDANCSTNQLDKIYGVIPLSRMSDTLLHSKFGNSSTFPLNVGICPQELSNLFQQNCLKIRYKYHRVMRGKMGQFLIFFIISHIKSPNFFFFD